MVTSSSKKRKLDIRQIKKKISQGEKLFKYEESYLRKKLRDRADHLAQKYPKLVAFKDKKRVKCLTCERVIEYDDANGSHWIEKGTSGQYRCRREKWNIYSCCEKCNAWDKERHHSMLTLHVTKLYGIERVEEKLAESFQPHKRPHRKDIMEVIEMYENDISNIK